MSLSSNFLASFGFTQITSCGLTIGSGANLGTAGRLIAWTGFNNTTWQSSDNTAVFVDPGTGAIMPLLAGTTKIMSRAYDRKGATVPTLAADPPIPGGATYYYDPFNSTGFALDTNNGTTRTTPKLSLFGAPSGAGTNANAADTFPAGGSVVVVLGSPTTYLGNSTGFVAKNSVYYQADPGTTWTHRCGVNLSTLTWTSLGAGRWSAAIPSVASAAYEMVEDNFDQQIRDTVVTTAVAGHFFNSGAGTLTWHTNDGLTPAGRDNCWFYAATWLGTKLLDGAVLRDVTLQGGKDHLTVAGAAVTYLKDCAIQHVTRRWVSMGAANATLVAKGFEGGYCGVGTDVAFDYTAAPLGNWYAQTPDSTSAGFFISNADGCTVNIQDFWMHHCIDNATAFQPTTNGSGSLLLRSGLVEYCGSDGIGVGTVGRAPQWTVDNVEVRYCCRNGLDRAGIHSFGAVGASGTITNCWLHDCGSMGGAAGVLGGPTPRTNADTPWGNGHQFDGGSHNCIARFNRATNNKLAGLSYIASDQCIFENNTLIGNLHNMDNRPGAGGTCQGVTIRNNLSMGSVGTGSHNLSIARTQSGSHPVVIDYNRYGADGGGDVKVNYDTTGTGGGTIQTTKAGTQALGIEAHGQFAAVTWTDATFCIPAPGDAAVNHGLVIVGVNDGTIAGGSPDIGWCEQGQANVITCVTSGFVIIPPGSPPNPANGVIKYDQRAGSIHDLAQYADYASAKAAAAYDNNDLGVINWTTNANADSKHSPRFDYVAGTSGSAEQDNNVEVPVAVAGNVYVSWKARHGRTATSGGSGALGSFGLLGSHSNAHIKHILLNRSDGNRIYMKMTPGAIEFDIDNNNFVSNTCDLSVTGDPLSTLVGTEMTFVLQITPSSTPTATDGQIHCWLNGRAILTQTNCLLGTGTLTNIQSAATFLVPSVACSLLWYDLVVWK